MNTANQNTNEDECRAMRLGREYIIKIKNEFGDIDDKLIMRGVAAPVLALLDAAALCENDELAADGFKMVATHIKVLQSVMADMFKERFR